MNGKERGRKKINENFSMLRHGDKYRMDDGSVCTAKAAYNIVVAAGFKGCLETVLRRLKCGVTSFAELGKPASEGLASAGRKGALARAAKGKDDPEFLAALAAVRERRSAK